MEQNGIIEIRNLSKVFGTGDSAVTALSGIDLSVKAGEIFGIIGLSGAGKARSFAASIFWNVPPRAAWSSAVPI